MIKEIIGGFMGGIGLVFALMVFVYIMELWDNLPHNRRKAEKKHEQYLKDLEEYRKRG